MGLDPQFCIASLAVAAVVAAAVSDVRETRIPNRLTYPVMLIGIATHTVFFGWRGLLMSLASGSACGAILLVLYVMRTLGAGDVKLGAALGFVVGWPASLKVLTATAIAGGILAVIFMLLKGRVRETLGNTVSVLKFHAVSGIQAHPSVNLDNKHAARMPYALAFAGGTLYWAASVVLGR